MQSSSGHIKTAKKEDKSRPYHIFVYKVHKYVASTV
jgi:hypothetical protein